MPDPLVPSSRPTPGGAPPPRRLGKNINGYLGETIDLPSVLDDCTTAARAGGWSIEKIPAGPHLDLFAFTRPARSGPGHSSTGQGSELRIYLSTGIHGDEPAGPLAARQLLQDDHWPANAHLWLCPCLNPEGFALGRRENREGLDLNRQYLNPTAAETAAHIAWLQRQPAFDLCLCLHEDWEAHGFYLYEQNPDRRPSLAEAMVAAVADVCPIDCSDTIEGRSAQNGIIRPAIDPRTRPQWPEAFFLITHKTRQSYTLEAPSDFPLPARLAALVTAVNTALRVRSQQS
jgi:hypothetical protein